MEQLIVVGGNELHGTVSANGAKNSCLKMLFAAILTDKEVAVQRVPRLNDVDTAIKLIESLGAEVEQGDHELSIRVKKLSSVIATYDLVRTMRASILCLGPLLAREGRAKVSMPGGCAIGTRPVDLHLKGLEQMGAKFQLEEGYIIGECPSGLRGADISLKFPSVGATENIMLAATLARGTTYIRNAAREPEIADLARFLNLMGAKIEGAGSEKITIQGVNGLHGATTHVMFDRIETATLLLAGPITGGSVKVTDTIPGCLDAVLEKLRECGVEVEEGPDFIRASAGKSARAVNIKTEPFPGFPTDVQAQFMAYLAQVEGESQMEETIFENRYMHVPELNRLGANIAVSGSNAVIHGKKGCYKGATVMATDLRASASLVLAALAAKGKTNIRRIYHLDRGYESIEKKLTDLGANIRREEEK